MNSSFAWSWPQCRNEGGGAPTVTTANLGDQVTLSCESWGNVDGNWGMHRVWIHTSSDIQNGTSSAWSGYDDVQLNTSTTPVFTSTGTWYWGFELEYNTDGAKWYCVNDNNWYNMWGAPTSDLTIAVSALPKPTSCSASASASDKISLSWLHDAAYATVMIVAKEGSAATDPTQGTSYNVNDACGGGTVIFKGTIESFLHTGLTPGSTYYYNFYSVNNDYYSPIDANTSKNATTYSTPITIADGNWSNSATWLNSHIPGSSENAVIDHLVILDQDASVAQITINSGKSLTSESGMTRNLTVAGNFSNSGTFTANDGIVTIVSNAVISGTIDFNDVIISSGTDFGASSTINGILTISSGGFVNTNAPVYGAGSTLKYNSTGIYSRGQEWSSNSGSGYPCNIQITNSTGLNLGNGGTATARYCSGDITIDAGSGLYLDYGADDMTQPLTISGNLFNNGSLSLSDSPGGDLYLAGNWTSSGTFTSHGRFVEFNGTVLQTISHTSTTETFGAVFVNKSSGDLKLSSTDVVLTATSGYVLWMNNGNIDLNGRMLTLSGQGGEIRIDNGNRSMTSVSQSSILVTGNPSTTSKTITSDGSTLTFTSSVKLIVQSGCVDFGSGITYIEGTLEIKGNGCAIGNAPTYGSASYLVYNASGNFDRKIEWNDGSLQNVTVKNGTNLRMGDTPAQSRSMAGNLLVETGGNIYMQNRTASITVGGSFTIQTGGFIDMETMVAPLIINGNVFLDGTLELGDNIGGDMEVKGNWSRTGTLTPFARMVTFNGTTDQNIYNQTTFDYLKINNSGGAEVVLLDNIAANYTTSVENGAVFNLGTFVVSDGGSGTFETKTGSTIKIGSLAGITSSGASGNVQTSIRTFAGDAIYHYIGASDQFTGSGFPPILSGGKLIVELSAENILLTPSNSRTFAAGGELKIIEGTVLETGSGDIFSGSGNLTMTGGIYKFMGTVTTPTSSTQYPRLTGTYTLTGGKVELAQNCNASNKFQILKGAGRIYYNVHIHGTCSSGGYKLVSSSCQISNKLIIDDANTIFDLENNGVSGDGGLEMSAGRLRMAKLNTELPELTGMNQPYNITGGTIEFYGTASTEQQLINGNYGAGPTRISYYNIEINALAVNVTAADPGNVNAGSSFDIQNQLTVFSPAAFTLNETDIIRGTGNVSVQSGATLFYGSPDGIALGTTNGNIRVSGTRSYPADASYGFVSNGSMDVGSDLPGTVQNLYIYKTAASDAVNMDENLTINGILTLYKGQLTTGAFIALVDNASTTSVTGQSDNSYVVGTLKRKIGNAEYEFPVGTASYYELARLNITDAKTSTYIDSKFTWSPTESVSTSPYPQVNGIDVTTCLNSGYWTFNADIDSPDYDITATSQGHTNGGADPEQHCILKRDGGDWQSVGVHTNGTQSGTGSNPVTAKRSTLSGFSDFIIARSTADPLPVELLFLKASFRDFQVSLSWKTSSEINNERFEVYRSPDGNNPERIGTIAGKGNTNRVSDYSFTDYFPLQGVNYYRLYQYDYDGKLTKSEWVAAINSSRNIFSGQVSINVFPNPASNYLSIMLQAEDQGQYNLTIYDFTGRKVLTSTYEVIQGIGTKTIDISLLISGKYHLVIEGQSVVSISSFLKN